MNLDAAKVFESGTGSWTVELSSGSLTHGDLTIKRIRRSTKRAALIEAYAQQKVHGGYVAIIKGGAEVASVGPEGLVMERKHTRNVKRRAADSRHDEVPIANPGELTNSKRLWLFQFGAYGDTYVYAWNDSEEDAFEAAVEWLDEHAPGHLVDLSEADLREAAEDEGIEWQPTWPDWEDPAFARVVEAAEVDLTQIGHTTLKHGQYLRSHEWAFDEVTDEAEREEVAIESFEWKGVGDTMLDIDYFDEEPTHGLRVRRDAGYVEITEWAELGDGDVLRTYAHPTLEAMLDPKGKHRGATRGDADKLSLGAMLLMDARQQEEAFVAAADSWVAQYRGEQSHVSYIGED